MEVEFGGEYLNIESSRDGDIAEILNEGEWVEIVVLGQKKKVFNIKVRINGKEIMYTPGTKPGKMFIKAWGSDTLHWIGKKFEIIHLEGRMMVRPLSEVKVQ